MNQKSIREQLSDFVLSRNSKGLMPMTASQMRGPWSWHYSMRTTVLEGQVVEHYELKGVDIPADGDSPGHYVDVQELKWA